MYADQLQLNGLPAKAAWQLTWYLQMSPIPVGAVSSAKSVYNHVLCVPAREDGLTATGT